MPVRLGRQHDSDHPRSPLTRNEREKGAPFSSSGVDVVVRRGRLAISPDRRCARVRRVRAPRFGRSGGVGTYRRRSKFPRRSRCYRDSDGRRNRLDRTDEGPPDPDRREQRWIDATVASGRGRRGVGTERAPRWRSSESVEGAEADGEVNADRGDRGSRSTAVEDGAGTTREATAEGGGPAPAGPAMMGVDVESAADDANVDAVGPTQDPCQPSVVQQVLIHPAKAGERPIQTNDDGPDESTISEARSVRGIFDQRRRPTRPWRAEHGLAPVARPDLLTVTIRLFLSSSEH